MTMLGRNRTFLRPRSPPSPLSSYLDKLLFWRKDLGRAELKHRIIVPNHLVSEGTPPEQHPNHGCLGNQIRTTKYTLLSFLPKNLFEQFHRFANLYFLFIVLLNWVPQINAFGKEIAMIPVIFVLGVTSIKDMFEDRRRYTSDKRINNSTCRTFSNSAGRYVKVLWKSVQVGDLVHLSCNELIPADILLLRSSDEQGLCFIETANLDGESNLKQRQVVRGLNSQKDSFHPTMFRSTIECDLPNNKIYRFHGSIIQPSGDRIPISKDNLLLRDCVLKNTDYVEGIVVYAGHETKAMLNNSGPRYKRSKLERRMNWDVMWCVVILVVLCFIGATGSGLWLSSYNNTRSVPFIHYEGDSYNPPYEGFLAFWTFVIILQVMIPLSLYVSIEIIKLGQVYHIHNDLELYDTATNKRLECRALNIPEELGQVEYIFSDKTGTLTENSMVFRRCTIGGIDYNHHHSSVSESGGPDVYNQTRGMYDTAKSATDADFILNPHLQEELSQMDLQLMICSGNSPIHLTPQNQRIQDFFLLMAVCNTVVVSKRPHQDKMNSSGLYLDSAGNPVGNEESPMVKIKQPAQRPKQHFISSGSSPPPSYDSTPVKKQRLLPLPLFGNGRAASPTPSPGELRPIYEAESPDELALVNAAYHYNCRLLKRLSDSVTLALPGEGLVEFKVLHVMPFDSQRKRMSVVLQHPFTKEVVVYCKGADSSMFPNLAHPKNEEMKQMIFRTQQHLNNYARRGLRILVMAKRVLTAEQYSSWLEFHRDAELTLDDREQTLLESACRLEKDMELIGATGIEDRLQEGVPETIAALRQAGIVVWVLTGDKQETAVNIAYSCRLFSYDMEIITLNARSKESTEETIKFYVEQIKLSGATEASTPSSMWSSASAFLHAGRKRGLVVDGRTLAYILDDKEVDHPFLELARECHAVLCCRATPFQKASIVKLVKEQMHVLTVAVGDGANDVSMIQTADIGIGISGQEGMQAVMSSDFAMSRFSHLDRLLLVHGHWCYDRLARMVLYFFYKNAGIIFIIFWFQLFCGFSGMLIVEQLHVMLYNLFFTSLPPLIIGIYDQDAPSELLLSKPELYRQGRLSQVYRSYSFWINTADAFYQSTIIFFFPMLAYEDSTVGLFEFGTTITTCCLSVQLLHLCIECKSWTALHLSAMVISVVVYFGFSLAYNAICLTCTSLLNPYWVMQHTMGTAVFWLNILLVSVAALLPRLVIRMFQASLNPSDVAIALMAQKGEDDSPPDAAEFNVAWSRSTSISSVVRIGDSNQHHQQQSQHRPARTTLTEVA